MRGTKKSTIKQVSSGCPSTSESCLNIAAQIKELQNSLNTHSQTNLQQANILTELRRQSHSDFCECSCHPMTSFQILATQRDTLQQLLDQSVENRRLWRQEESAMHEEKHQHEVAAVRSRAEVQHHEMMYRPWKARIQPLQRVLRWVKTCNTQPSVLTSCWLL